MRHVATRRNSVILGIAILVLSANTAFADGSSEASKNRAIIRPSLVHLEPGQEQRFKVAMKATRMMAAEAPQSVRWSVNNIPGGNEQFGTIRDDGTYRAPEKEPVPHEIHICAEVGEAANPHLWATVLMGDPKPSYKKVGGWTEPIKDSEYLVNPHGIGLDKQGNVLISDLGNNRVMRFTKEGRFLTEIGLKSGHGPGQFSQPRVVVTDHDGNIYVADQKSDRPRIQVFDPNGQFLRIFAEKGTRPGDILRAHGMGFDPEGHLFVTDVDNMRVNVYQPSGEFLYDFGGDGMGPGQFNAPHGLIVDPNGDVFVQNYYGPCQKLTGKGDYLFEFSHGDPPDGPLYFHSIAGDRWGNVYITVRGREGYDNALQIDDGTRVGIMKYNNNGDYITSICLSVKGHRESWAVVDDEGRIYTLYQGVDDMGVEIMEQQ